MHRTRPIAVAAAAGTLLLTGAAHAGSVIVDSLGGDMLLHSKHISGVFGDQTPVFNRDAMLAVHSDLHASGITTDGFVTFLVADTDHGLAFMALVDDPSLELPQGPYHMAQLGMTSTAPISNIVFVNDSKHDIQHVIDLENGLQVAAGVFTWNSYRRGDAFAWSNLNIGDYASFNFTRGGEDHDSFPGLHNENTFQFVSWTGTDWEVVAQRNFSSNDQFAFSFTVIPLPAPLLTGLIGFGFAALVRGRSARRRDA